MAEFDELLRIIIGISANIKRTSAEHNRMWIMNSIRITIFS